MNIQLKLTAIALMLLMAITSLTMAAPSPWQLGRVSRQLCDNLNNITVGEMKNISTLSQFKDKKIQADSAMSQIMQAQQYIQSNYVDSTSRLIAEGNMEPQDRDFALDFQPRLVNTYRKCDLWINGFLFGKPDTISDVDYASMENYCKVEPQNLYKTHCEPPPPAECTEKGTRVGKTAWRKFKRGAGVELCTKLAEVNTLIAELAIDNPLTPCDDVYNEELEGYIGEQVDLLGDKCEKERAAKEEQERLTEEQRKRDEKTARLAEEKPLISGRYQDNGDGTVTDITTNLMWKRCAEEQTWTGSTCSGEGTEIISDEFIPNGRQKTWGSFAGYSDWQVPTIEQLRSLVYCSSGKPKTWNYTENSCDGEYQIPTIDTSVFPNTAATWFWSATAGDALVLPFGNGDYDYWGDKYAMGQVRLVRARQ